MFENHGRKLYVSLLYVIPQTTFETKHCNYYLYEKELYLATVIASE